MRVSQIVEQSARMDRILREGVGRGIEGESAPPAREAAMRKPPQPPRIPPIAPPNAYARLMKKHDRFTQRHLK